MNATFTATLFYMSVGALVGGVIRSLRASVERRTRDRWGIALAGIGAIGLFAAVIAFATGPRDALPF